MVSERKNTVEESERQDIIQYPLSSVITSNLPPLPHLATQQFAQRAYELQLQRPLQPHSVLYATTVFSVQFIT